MRHIRYFSDRIPICEKPERLDWKGGEFVVADSGIDPEPHCKDCGPLLAAHNKREYEKESYAAMKIVKPAVNREGEPGEFDQFITGVLLASAFWVTFFIILWAVFWRG
jgi:hypothetical protein